MVLQQGSKVKGPLLLLAVLFFSLFFGGWVPVAWKSVAYGISLTIKEVLIFVLPVLIFSFVFSSMVNLGKRAMQFVLLVIPLVCLSNFTSTWLAYFSGSFLIPNNIAISDLLQSNASLPAPWAFKLPQLISNDMALLFGFTLGLISAFAFPDRAGTWSLRLVSISHAVLNRFFVPIMPIFILGFTLKLAHDQILSVLLQNYLAIFLIIFCSVFGYILFAYGLLSGFRFQVWRESLRNMWPAALAGFSTMSSAAAMPLTLLAAEKNTERPEISGPVIPATVNIHLVGDCFAIPIFALAILLSFGSALPDFSTYAIFVLYFVLAKFAVAAVPGGGILVMLPVLE
ncbi:MAG: cation:dicarboxylase symporter family transporter, partial [Myxococcaceae bacterium]